MCKEFLSTGFTYIVIVDYDLVSLIIAKVPYCIGRLWKHVSATAITLFIKL
jgi:hypothetical protein